MTLPNPPHPQSMNSTATFTLNSALADDSDEGIMDDSDLEDLDRASPSGGQGSRDYWLGKRIFAQLLTFVVFEENPSAGSGDDLDVRFHATRYNVGGC